MKQNNPENTTVYNPLQHFEYSDPSRITAVFEDVERLNRGRLSGEYLAKYLELQDIYKYNGNKLSRAQGIEIMILLNHF